MMLKLSIIIIVIGFAYFGYLIVIGPTKTIHGKVCRKDCDGKWVKL
jgi:hypothetical protein